MTKFSDHYAPVPKAFIDAWRGLIKFDGRTTRTEVFDYLLSCVALALTLIIGLLIVENLVGSISETWANAASLLAWLPALGLFVRRLNDVGLPRWLGAIFPTMFALSALVGNFDWFQPIDEASQASLWIVIPHGIFVLAFYAIMLWPGQRAANKFGPNPRFEQG